jgi:light-regulated signal transduction histidine kinase (bacteriophytochrome)
MTSSVDIFHDAAVAAAATLQPLTFTHASRHQLNEPLRRIRVLTTRLAQAESNEAKEECIKRVDQNVVRLQSMLGDLMGLAELENPSGRKRKVPLLDCLNRAVSHLAPRIIETRATIFTGDLDTVFCDAHQMETLFFHLLDNSIKYRRKSEVPAIRIYSTHSPVPGYLQIMVEDNGIGFDERFSGRIFEMFFRLHTQEEYPGNGIGLTLCKKIAENHGGSIEARCLPRGSSFRILLPE